MSLRVKRAHKFQRFAAIDEIVYYKDAFAIAHNVFVWRFENFGFAALVSFAATRVVGFDRNGIDRANVEFAGHDHARRHAAARDSDDGFPCSVIWAVTVEPPCKGAGVAVELVPAYVETFFVGQTIHRSAFRNIWGIYSLHADDVIACVNMMGFAGYARAKV